MPVTINHPARWLGCLFWATLLVSYIGLAWIYQNIFLFEIVVHEDGQQTFLELLFNPSHFLREMPLSIIICLGVVGAYIYSSPYPTKTIRTPDSKRQVRLYYTLALVIVLVAILSTTIQYDLATVWYELAQYKTRGDTLQFGSHWYNHFLHLLFIPLQALGLCSLIRWANRKQVSRSGGGNKGLLLAWIGGFLLLWLVFGFKWIWAEQALYLAHQLREIATHGTLSISLILGTCFYLEEKSGGLHRQEGDAADTSYLSIFWTCLGITLCILAFLFWRLLGVNVLELAQKEASYLELFFSHNFEHFIDYLFMGLVTAGIHTSTYPASNQDSSL